MESPAPLLSKTHRARRLVTESVTAWMADHAPSMGAALSYYTLFSIAPLLVIAIAVAGLIFGREAAQGHVLTQLRGLLGADGALAVESLLQSASDPERSGTAAIIGIATLLIGATTVFAELQSALDRIWRAPAITSAKGLWRFARARVLSFGMVLGLGFLLLVSLLVSAALSALGNWWNPLFGSWERTAQALNVGFGLVLVTLIFAFIYKLLPRADIGWRDVWVGAAITSLLFAVGKMLIGMYLARVGTASAFGAAGSLAVLLVWVYYSGQIFLLGAEFTWVYAHREGTRVGMDAEQPAGAAQDANTKGAKTKQQIAVRTAAAGVAIEAAEEGRPVPSSPAPPATKVGIGALAVGAATLVVANVLKRSDGVPGDE